MSTAEPGSVKTKLTLTVDRALRDEAKRVAGERGISLSRAVENFLKFFVDPGLYCFKCGRKFKASEGELCPKCGWLICPHCGACRCSLSDEVAAAVFYMRRTLEELLAGRVK